MVAAKEGTLAPCLESLLDAERQQAHFERPKSWLMLPMMPTLTAIRPPVSARTMGHCWNSRATSKELPVVTKNRPRRMPRNGRTSASTCTQEAKQGQEHSWLRKDGLAEVLLQQCALMQRAALTSREQP